MTAHLEKQLLIVQECFEEEKKKHEATRRELQVAVGVLRQQLETLDRNMKEERAKADKLTATIEGMKKQHEQVGDRSLSFFL